MTRALSHVTAGPGAPDVGLAREAHRILSGATLQGRELVLLAGKELLPEDRVRMEARLARLRECLDHRDPPAVAQAVARLLAGFPAAAKDDDKRGTIAAFVDTMSDVPAWAALNACRLWPRGAFGPASAFPPSASQLCEAALKIARVYFTEAELLERVLTARVPAQPEGERERVLKGFETLSNELRGRAERNTSAARRETAQARARYNEMCRAAGVDPDSVRDQPQPLGAWKTLASDASPDAMPGDTIIGKTES